MKTCIIIGDANGSGKTTIAQEWIAQGGYPFINADEIEKDLDNTGSGAAHVRAGRLLFEKVDEMRLTGQSFMLESTLSGKYLEQTIQRLKADGYSVTIEYVYLEAPEMCIERIANRVKKGGHFIDNETVVRRYWRSLSHFWNDYRLLANKWSIYRNTDDGPEEIAFGIGGKIEVQDENPFSKFIQLVEHGK